jgi:hypothetical protein
VTILIPEVRRYRLTREIGSLKPDVAQALMSGVAMVDKRLAVMAYPRVVGPQSPGFALLDWNGEVRFHVTSDESSRTYVGIYNDGDGREPTAEFEVKYNSATSEYRVEIANAHATSLYVTGNAQFGSGILHIPESTAPTTIQEMVDQAFFIIDSTGSRDVSDWDVAYPDGWLTIDTNGEPTFRLRSSYTEAGEYAYCGFDFNTGQTANCYTDYLKPASNQVATASTLTVSHGTLICNGGLVVNEAGNSDASVDFRVEGDTETHVIFVDASADEVFLGGSAGMKVSKGGYLHPVSSANADAPSGTIYYSTDASKLVFKDSGGTVNNLY